MEALECRGALLLLLDSLFEACPPPCPPPPSPPFCPFLHFLPFVLSSTLSFLLPPPFILEPIRIGRQEQLEGVRKISGRVTSRTITLAAGFRNWSAASVQSRGVKHSYLRKCPVSSRGCWYPGPQYTGVSGGLSNAVSARWLEQAPAVLQP